MATDLATTTQETTTGDKLEILVAETRKLQPHLQQLKVDETRFLRIVLNELQRNPKLGLCSPGSFYAAVLLSAQLNLEPGPLGLSWFIPRRVQGVDKVVWMLGYKGIVELASRANITIQTGSVYEGEHFVEHGGTSPSIEHQSNPNPQGEPIAWYAVATLPDGRTVHRVLGKAEVEKRRKVGGANSTAWKDWHDSMARKTCIRAMQGLLPLSAEMRLALNADDQVQQLGLTGVETEAEQMPTSIAAGATPVPHDPETGEILSEDAAPAARAPEKQDEPVDVGGHPEQSAAVEVQDRPTDTGVPQGTGAPSPTTSSPTEASPPRPVSPRDKADARRQVIPGDVPLASSKQLGFLVMLAEEMGWDDQTRCYRADVESFKELTFDRAHALIEDWTLKVNDWRQNRRSRLVSELEHLKMPIKELLVDLGVTSVHELTAKQCQQLLDELEEYPEPDEPIAEPADEAPAAPPDDEDPNLLVQGLRAKFDERFAKLTGVVRRARFLDVHMKRFDVTRLDDLSAEQMHEMLTELEKVLSA